MSAIHKFRGFTLVELLVSIAIVAIVSAIAIPLYTTYSMRSYRAELQSDLLACSQALERFNAMNFTYEGTADTDNDGAGDADAGPIASNLCNALSVQQNRYAITIAAGVNGYTLTGAPVNGGPMDDDGDFTLDDAGNRTWNENNDGNIDADENDWAED